MSDVDDSPTVFSWVLLTGEYPPQPGGVADYTRRLAQALVAAGDKVHVFAPPCESEVESDSDVTVHRLPDHYGSKSRRMLQAALKKVSYPRAAVLQYVPQSFGMRGCNIPFTSWLKTISRYPLFVMFHEVSVTVRHDTPLKYRIQAWATRKMAASTIAAAEAIFVSTPAWEPLISELGLPRVAVEWTPVASNLSLNSSAYARDAIRRHLNTRDFLLGHFGTYREAYSCNALREVVRDTLGLKRSILFMGRGSHSFAEKMRLEFPEKSSQILSTGGLQAQDLSDHLSACDVLIQPYEDGVSARRSTVMSAIALGIPVVTSRGATTESLWYESGAVALVPASAVEAFAEVLNQIEGDRARLAQLAARGRTLYAERFAVEHTVSALQSKAIGYGLRSEVATLATR